MQLEALRCRDPFFVRTEGRLLLFRSHDGEAPRDVEGVDVLISTDGKTWSDPQGALRLPNAGNCYWAPEVHAYQGHWYLLVTVTGQRPGCGVVTPLGRETLRGTCIFRADRAEGPYTPWSDGPVTPWEQLALDGTLYVDPDGQPYMIYCHEWLQMIDGTVEAIPLSPDLKKRTGDPFLLFRASQAGWCHGQYVAEACGIRFDCITHVTDGVFPFRDASGHLCLLWSTGSEGKYQTGIARNTAWPHGEWTHAEKALFSADGGHAMLLQDTDGKLLMALHQPNVGPLERAKLIPVEITWDGLKISESEENDHA